MENSYKTNRRYSQRAEQVPPALSIYINDLVYQQIRRGYDITTLSLGEAFFDIPQFDFSKIDFVKGYHYSDSQGLPELRKKIKKYYREQYKCNLSKKTDILITAGSKAAIYLAILAVVDSGNEVLIHEPAWLSYQEHARLVDAVPTFIPFNTPVNRFCEYINENTRLIIINNPNNPAGRLYSKQELSEIVSTCRKHAIWLIVDEAYSDYLEHGDFHSAIDFDPDCQSVIITNSLSKNMGMSGWRIGYLIANSKLIDNVRRLNQHIITCAPTVLQLYILKYFDQILSITLPQARDVTVKRRRLAAKLDSLGIEYLPGCGTFYFFVHIGTIPTTDYVLSMYLLLFHNIATVPGSAYGSSTERFLRLSIGSESEERIIEAFIVLSNVLHYSCDFEKLVSDKLSELRIPRYP